TAVRAGDRDAYGVLWGRHETAARNLARQIAKSSDVDELVSESFYRVLRALDGGGGPDGAFRPYLLSTLRRVNIDTGRGYYQRVSLTDDDTELEGTPGDSAADIAIEQGEQTAAWKAWASLPDSSRTLLWHLLVEEETPAAIAPLMGTTPNGVSSRAVRAKERLRQAFLQQHVRLADAEQCEWTRLRVGEYVRSALSNREHEAVEVHLKDCKRCKAVVAEITDVNQSLKVLVAPVILGAAAVGYLHAAGASTGLHLVGLGQLRRLVRPSVLAGAASVVAVAGIAAGLVAANQGGHPKAAPPPPTPPAQVVQQPPAPSPPPVKPKPKPKPPVVPPPVPPPTTPTPTPTPPTPTPTPPSTKAAPPAAPSPKPKPPSTPPTTPPSTPPPSTPPPSEPPPPTIYVSLLNVEVSVQFDILPGLLVVTVPPQWQITDVHPQNLRLLSVNRCTINSPTRATCRVSGLRFGPQHDFSVTATGPRTTPPPMLHAEYTELWYTAPPTDYPLI
ncbi:MAG TPA: sigma-70 family RNA polymerase sigma factor, partial [Jatrophihabitantaceae bacterium]|nr:sigma-70 family RNA polymerase sigma factor [Jatrophihabitantaceae bacterium]